MKTRLVLAALAAVVLAAAAPAAAPAATATVTGDTGTPVPLGGPLTIRHMDPDISVSFAESEQRNIVDVVGPGGARAVSGEPFCSSSSSYSSGSFRYLGNGTYTVIVKTYNGEDCNGTAQETRFDFGINAFSGVAAPAAQLLGREPDTVVRTSIPFKVEINPGANRHELRFARNAAIGADGGIAGASEQAFVNSSDGTAGVVFPGPGTWTLVARAIGFNGTGDQPTAWSAPVKVQVFEPFDLAGPTSFLDSIGPSYKIAGTVRAAAANGGKVTISIARGTKGGKFKRIKVAKINSKGRFSFAFKLTRRGIYRLRYTYKGSALVAPGTVQEAIRIRRIFR